MRYTDHDQLAAEALRLRDAVRGTEPVELYDQLTRDCAADPERMAQVIMTLAVLVDPAAGGRRLAQLADEVVAGMTDTDTAARQTVAVTLVRDVRTDTTIVPAGSVHEVVPADRGWVLHVDGSAVRIPLAAARLKRRAHNDAITSVGVAREEYAHATTILGMSHGAALQWLMDRFGVTDRQLYRWGFSIPEAATA